MRLRRTSEVIFAIVDTVRDVIHQTFEATNKIQDFFLGLFGCEEGTSSRWGVGTESTARIWAASGDSCLRGWMVVIGICVLLSFICNLLWY